MYAVKHMYIKLKDVFGSVKSVFVCSKYRMEFLKPVKPKPF